MMKTACSAAILMAVTASADVFAAARHDDGRRAIFLARYAEDNNFTTSRPVTVKLAGGEFPPEVCAYVTDEVRMQTEMPLWPLSARELTVRMPPNSFMLIDCGARAVVK